MQALGFHGVEGIPYAKQLIPFFQELSPSPTLKEVRTFYFQPIIFTITDTNFDEEAFHNFLSDFETRNGKLPDFYVRKLIARFAEVGNEEKIRWIRETYPFEIETRFSFIFALLKLGKFEEAMQEWSMVEKDSEFKRYPGTYIRLLRAIPKSNPDLMLKSFRDALPVLGSRPVIFSLQKWLTDVAVENNRLDILEVLCDALDERKMSGFDVLLKSWKSIGFDREPKLKHHQRKIEEIGDQTFRGEEEDPEEENHKEE